MAIGIVGASGAGKTSLCLALAERLGATAIIEDISQNPFVCGPQAATANLLDVELGFLRLREQWNLAAQQARSAGSCAILDTTLWTSRVYAETFLSKDELRIFEEAYLAVMARYRECDIIIHLFGPADLLAARAMSRNGKTGLEERQSKSKIIAVCEAGIAAYLDRIRDTRVIDIDVGKIDLRTVGELSKLIEKIKAATLG